MKRIKSFFILLFFLLFGIFNCFSFQNIKPCSFQLNNIKYYAKNSKNVKNIKNSKIKYNFNIFFEKISQDKNEFFQKNAKNVIKCKNNNKKYIFSNFLNKKTGKNKAFCKSFFDEYGNFENFHLRNSNSENFFKNGDFKEILIRKYTFYYKNRVFKFNSCDFEYEKPLSDWQKYALNNKNTFIAILNHLKCLNLSKREILTYLLPEIEEIKLNLCCGVNISPEAGYVEVIENSCLINYKSGGDGLFLNQEDFYDKIYKSVEKCDFDIKIDILTEKYNNFSKIEECYREKSSFSTNFETSTAERKNNIRLCLSKFDGLILEPGEILSFNTVTGKRSEENGYKKAKIISGGTFIYGVGGGVCQVSTTLYNACLLAGFEILEVHNHSLPVSYVEPSFDAMVNTGSSDLIVRNNTSGRILITTSYKNDICKVKIFGKKNKYKITRFSEKTKIIPASSDKIEEDYEKFGDFNLLPGEEIRLSYPKDGFISSGYLKFYDEQGVLVKTEKIRECKYNPTRGIVLKNTNFN